MASTTTKRGMPARPTPQGASRAGVAGFLGSLAALVGALVLVFVVLYPKGSREPQPAPKAAPDATELANESKRKAMRPTVKSQASDFGPAVVKTAPADAQTVAPDVASEDEEDPDIQKAINLVDAGNVSDTQALLDGVLKRDPKNEQALVEMAMIQLLDLKQTDQAVVYLQRALDVNPGNPVVMSELVSLYEEQGRVEEGLAYMQEVQARNPESLDLAHGVGQKLTHAGKDQEAIEYYERATGSPEYSVRAYRDLADAYSKTGDKEHAVDAYGKAIASQEQEIQEKAGRGLPVQFAQERLAYTKLEMACALLDKGDVAQAEGLLEEIAPILPGDESLTALRDTIKRKKAG
jgi:tetratricopeptide (TPR) repeat protein